MSAQSEDCCRDSFMRCLSETPQVRGWFELASEVHEEHLKAFFRPMVLWSAWLPCNYNYVIVSHVCERKLSTKIRV